MTWLDHHADDLTKLAITHKSARSSLARAAHEGAERLRRQHQRNHVDGAGPFTENPAEALAALSLAEWWVS
jgi:hypothetical protein